MALEQKLSLKLAQKLVMTPSLQQAIKLLQMTRLELEGVLSQELEENPVLEELEQSSEEEPAADERESEQLEEALSDIDVEAFFGDDYVESWEGTGAPSMREERQGPPIENTLAAQDDLYDHLRWQLQMMDVDPLVREIAELIIGNLDPDGFLGATITEIQGMGADGYRENLLPELLRQSAALMAEAPTEEGQPEEGQPEEGQPEEESDAGSGSTTPAAATAEPAVLASEIPASGAPASAGGSLGHGSAAAPEPSVPGFLRADPAVPGPEVALGELGGSIGDPPAGGGAGDIAGEGGEPGVGDPAGEPAGEEAAAVNLPEGSYPRAAAEQALALVRSLDPPGVACRDLRESLLCQLERMGEPEDSLTFRVVEEKWDLFTRRKFEQIAKEIGVPLAQLKPVVEVVGGLETRPGREYGGDRTQYVEPDVHVMKVGGEYVIQLNDNGLPRLRVSRSYRRMLQAMRREGSEEDAQQYIKDKMRSALWLIKSLDQ
ncbi:MAG: hypothetical protein MI919_00955, partial [Holophagales bacterium]|nr:hypothetical protein [Holophagales bacterium]